MGCGNGKYLHLRNILHTSNSGQDTPSTSSSPSVVTRDCLTIGVDRSAELIDLAQDMTLDKMASGSNASAREEAATSGTSSRRRTNEVAVGDGLSSGFRSHAFDYAISIATIHHFSTRQRRRESIQELIRLVQPVESQTDDQSAMGGRGRFLVYVWALEQRGQERRKFDEDDSRRRGDLNSSSNNTDNDGVPQGRDVLVPWVLRKETAAAKEDQDAEQEDKVFQRCKYSIQGPANMAFRESDKHSCSLRIQTTIYLSKVSSSRLCKKQLTGRLLHLANQYEL